MKRNNSWTFAECEAAAFECNSRWEFQKRYNKQYQFASHRGWLDLICGHMDEPATLYYIRVHHLGRNFYKVGVTTNKLSLRLGNIAFAKDRKLLLSERFASKVDALQKEREILSHYKRYLVYAWFIKSGRSEVFDRDVLGLDNEREEQVEAGGSVTSLKGVA